MTLRDSDADYAVFVHSNHGEGTFDLEPREARYAAVRLATLYILGKEH